MFIWLLKNRIFDLNDVAIVTRLGEKIKCFIVSSLFQCNLHIIKTDCLDFKNYLQKRSTSEILRTFSLSLLMTKKSKIKKKKTLKI